MAGGINRPFEVNVKCVVFGGALVLGYWVLPCRYDPSKYLTSALIFTTAYVAMAQYDHMYECEGRLKHMPGLFNTLTGGFKPPVQEKLVFEGGKVGSVKTCQSRPPSARPYQ